jgi:BlaI family penicillinase repressor
VNRKHQLAELQLAIMQVLWEQGEASVGTVRDALEPRRSLAYTTIGTMLTKMEEKRLVDHRSDGRVNIYRPLVEQEHVGRSMVADLRERLFHGDVSQMLCHLLDGEDVTQEDLTELKRLIRRKERELKNGR